MKRIVIGVLLLLGVMQFHTLLGQTDLSKVGREHMEEGKIRIKLKKESLIEINSLKSIKNDSEGITIGVESIDNVSKVAGIHRIKRVFPFSVKHEEKHRAYGFHLWYELEFDEGINQAAVVAQYAALPEVQIAKPVLKKVRLDGDVSPMPVDLGSLVSDGAIRSMPRKASLKSEAATTFNDPLLPKQWHYHNDGTIGEENMDINLFNAWTINTGRNDVIVAIVDGGVDYSHEDLHDNMLVNESEMNGESGVDDDGNGYVDDVYGYNFVMGGNINPHNHGTHVAGTVAAVNNNGIGVAGIAGGDGSGNGVRLVSCQVFDDRAKAGGNFAAAIMYGADMGAVISQNSWGYSTSGYYEPEVLDAIRYFVAEAGQYEGSPMKGGVLFFATGNSAIEGLYYPAAFDEVIAVTATGPTGQVAPYSNYGDWTDIAAPGGDQSLGSEAGVLSTLPSNKYGFMQGTSMACPHVSGVAALAVAQFGGEDFHANELEKIILSSVNQFIFDHQGKFGRGLLNASMALAENNFTPPEAIVDLSASEVSYNQVTLKWTVPRDEDNFEPSEFILAIGQKEITDNSFYGYETYEFENSFVAGSVVSITLSGFWKETDYWFAVKSADRYGNVSDISNVLKVTTTDQPFFKESTRELEFSIDVTQGATEERFITFSNEGEGLVYWNSSITNLYSLWLDLEEWDYITTEKKSLAEKSPELFEETKPVAQPLAILNNASIEGPVVDHWKNDNTEFIYGMSYETGESVMTLSAGSLNAGLITATRFNIPTNVSFNLTHIEAGMLMESKTKPVIIEIKQGSKDLQSAKTIYVQEYYPDTTNVAKMYRIPLYKPQRIEEQQYLWVVFHFDKDEDRPFLIQDDLSYTSSSSNFLVSLDNGFTYRRMGVVVQRPVVPLLRVLSSGDDGSFVFINPTEGKIGGGKSEQVKLEVDAQSLTNGKHLASVGVNTTDLNKPGISINVKVNVSGQKAKVKKDDVYRFDIHTNTVNKLKFILQNIGLGTLELYGVTSESGAFVSDFDETIIALPGQNFEVPVSCEISNTGILQETLVLKTNIGDVLLNSELIAVEAPSIQLSLSADSVSLLSTGAIPVELNITNTGAGTSIEYNLEHYSHLNQTKRIFGHNLKYTLSSSDEEVGPLGGKWEEIKDFGIRHDYYEMDMDFPFYNQALSSFQTALSSQIYFYRGGYFGNESSNLAIGMISPMLMKNTNMRIGEAYYHDFGDHIVLSYIMHLYKVERLQIVVLGEVEYQVALFQNGSIEFRYKNVDDLESISDYSIGIQGMEKEDYLLYKNWDETSNTVHNGLVLRFDPDIDAPFITVYDNIKGRVNPGETQTVVLNIEPSAYKRYSSTYNTLVDVFANTSEGYHQLPLTVNINGVPKFSAVDSVNYQPLRIGESSTEFVKVENKGEGSGSITNITFDNDDFSLGESLPVEIQGKSNRVLSVIYTPSAPGEVEAKMIIDFSNGQRELVLLSSIARLASEYNFAIQSNLTVDLKGGEITQIPFSVSNIDKGVELEYCFLNSVFASVEADGQRKAEGHSKEVITSSYGYTWKVSDDSKVFYKWNDITEKSKLLKIEHGKQQMVKLPFSFPFYGEVYDSLWVSVNGYVTVVEPEKDFSSMLFKKDDGLRGMIAPFWGALVPSADNSGVKLLVESDRIYLQWEGCKSQYPNTEPGTTTFQLELVEDGSIYFHYKDVENWGGGLQYGLESPDESDLLEDKNSYIIGWSRLKDRTTISIAPPLKSQLYSGEQKDFNLRLSAENIYYPGVYNDTVRLITNSYLQTALDIPVVLNVTGFPTIEVMDSLTWDEVVFKPDTRLVQKVKIGNQGYDRLQIHTISKNNLKDLILYDEQGEIINKTSGGKLLQPIIIDPWETTEITVEISVSEKVDVNGEIQMLSNAPTALIAVKAKLVDSPVFSWTAEDQVYELNNRDKQQYVFSINNNGISTLKYDLIPAVIPASDKGDDHVIIDEIGHYQFDHPTMVDSIALDFNQIADGVFTPQVEQSELAFSNEFLAPEGGFFLTHIKVYVYMRKKGEYVRIAVYGEGPNKGDVLYEQKYVIDEPVNEEWVYFPLKKPITIPAGTKFYPTIYLPGDTKFIGFDSSNNPEVLSKSYLGSWSAWTNDYEFTTGDYLQAVNKIRVITAAGIGQWIELDQLVGELKPGEKNDITVNVNTALAGQGEHKAKILVRSNDINNSSDEALITINVNSAPEFKLRPNQYSDTLKMQETEKKVLNYLFTDFEDDSMSISMETLDEGPRATFIQTGDNTAQVEFKTDFESAGVYTYYVHLKDAYRNVTTDSIVLEVIDKNRPPVLNPDFERIQLNLAGPEQVFTIDPRDLFVDPDGDELQFYVGNQTPDIVDLAVGYNYLDLHPLREGTGFVVFGADDGKENGFVLCGVYVIIINDPNAVMNGEGSDDQSEMLLDGGTPILIYPNPVVEGSTNILFKLEEDSDVMVEIFDVFGRKLNVIQEKNLNSGVHQQKVDFTTFGTGLYIFRYLVNGEIIESKKVVVK